MRSTKLLFISDNQEMFTILKQHFSDLVFEVDCFPASNEAITELNNVQPEMILLDCAEEGVHELTLCQKIRNLFAGPLVLMSPQKKEQFTLLALQLGADVSLPNHSNVLLTAANITALLNRLCSSSLSILEFDELTIDAVKRDAFISGEGVNLSTVEFDLLWLLSKKAGQVVSREFIHRQLYNTSYNGYDRNIDLYVSRIRKKIADDPLSPKFLRTVRNTGYQFMTLQNEPKHTR